MENSEKEKLEKELELINKLEKFKNGIFVFRYINSKYKDPNLYYMGPNDEKSFTQAEFDEMKQYYSRVICFTSTVVTRENIHLYRKQKEENL